MLWVDVTDYLSSDDPICINTHAVYTEVLPWDLAVVITHSAQGARPLWRTGTTVQKHRNIKMTE